MPQQESLEGYQRKSYRAYVLGLLTVAYVFNFVDRQIIAILQDPIKTEFGLSDTQLGLLNGFAFAAFYVAFGLPIARWADRGVRRNIVALAVGVWSLMTAVCGFTQNYGQLLLARMGVGVGEAGCSPPAHSMISDIFQPSTRATAMSTYSLGVNIGILIGFMAGGWLNEFYGWRVAFLAVGFPGIVLAVLIKMTVKEPERGFSEHTSTLPGTTTSAVAAPGMWRALHHLWSFNTMRWLALGCGLASFAGYGLANWMPSFLVRTHAMATGELGTWLALLAGVGGGVGTFAGGFFSDRLARHDRRWYVWLPACAIGLSLPLLALAFLIDDKIYCLLAYIIPASVITIYLGPAIAVVHGLAENGMRAMASALLFLVINIVGLGLGPVAIGLLSDAFIPVFGADALRYALFVLVCSSALASVFCFFMAGRWITQDQQRTHSLACGQLAPVIISV